MFRFRRKTKHLIYAGLAGMIVSGIVFGGFMIVQTTKMTEDRKEVQGRLEAEILSLQEEAVSSKIQGWTPARELPAGHVITLEDLMPVELPEDSVPEDWLKTREQITGKTVKLAIRPNTLLTDTLLYEEEPTPSDLRFREMSFIQLPGALSEQDVVDVRIQFPTGQDYILLAKKKVRSLASGTVTMTLNEGEILSLSSAIVDAYLHKASIYALLYVEPSLQAKAIPTYPANEAVLKLIKQDPNIVGRAEHALSNFARSGLEADLGGMSAQSAAEYAGYQATQTQATPSPLSEADSQSGGQEEFVMGPAE